MICDKLSNKKNSLVLLSH